MVYSVCYVEILETMKLNGGAIVKPSPPVYCTLIDCSLLDSGAEEHMKCSSQRSILTDGEKP